MNIAKRPETNYVCGICDSIFLNNLDLVVHEITHTEEELAFKFKCYECGKRFAQKRQLSRHILGHSEELKPFICLHCHVRFKLETHLNMHLKKHDLNRPFVCKKCGYRYELKTRLEGHMKSHLDYRPYVCDICLATFKRSHDMKVHRSTHTNDKPFQCKMCESKFKKLAYLKKHERTHATERFPCQLCDAVFKDKRFLIGHIKTHDKVKEAKFVCRICNVNLPTSKELREHAKTHPEASKPRKSKMRDNKFHCHICGCNFPKEKSLELHTKLQHDGETRFKCRTCQANFTFEIYLNIHVVKHLEKKLFCEDCKTYCDSEYEMGIHEWEHFMDRMQVIENNESKTGETMESNVPSNDKYGVSSSYKRYNCQNCGSLFEKIKPLELHRELQHKGENPYRCQKCTASFNSPEYLNYHARKHNPQPVTCKRCKIKCDSEYRMELHEWKHVVDQLKAIEALEENTGEDIVTTVNKRSSTKDVEAKRFNCQYCGCRFNLPKQLELHTDLQHKGITPFRCHLCTASFNQENFLEIHVVKHTKKKIKCPRCKFIGDSEYEFGFHDCLKRRRQKVKEIKLKFHCDNCGCSFSNSHTFELHRKLQHEGVTPYTCNFCKATFTLEKFLVIHQFKHIQNVSDCSRCKTVCNSEYEAGIHEWYHVVLDSRKTNLPTSSKKGSKGGTSSQVDTQRKMKRYHCENCGCTFDFRNQYELHVSLQHTGQCDFKCAICDASFTKEMFLNNHAFKHVPKIVECSVCQENLDSEYAAGIHQWKYCLADMRVEKELTVPKDVGQPKSPKRKRVEQNTIDDGEDHFVEEIVTPEGKPLETSKDWSPISLNSILGDTRRVKAMSIDNVEDNFIEEILSPEGQVLESPKDFWSPISLNSILDATRGVKTKSIDNVEEILSPEGQVLESPKDFWSPISLNSILDAANMKTYSSPSNLNHEVKPCHVKLERISEGEILESPKDLSPLSLNSVVDAKRKRVKTEALDNVEDQFVEEILTPEDQVLESSKNSSISDTKGKGLKTKNIEHVEDHFVEEILTPEGQVLENPMDLSPTSLNSLSDAKEKKVKTKNIEHVEDHFVEEILTPEGQILENPDLSPTSLNSLSDAKGKGLKTKDIEHVEDQFVEEILTPEGQVRESPMDLSPTSPNSLPDAKRKSVKTEALDDVEDQFVEEILTPEGQVLESPMDLSPTSLNSLSDPANIKTYSSPHLNHEVKPCHVKLERISISDSEWSVPSFSSPVNNESVDLSWVVRQSIMF